MVKKNRHRAGRKKQERIRQARLLAQQVAAESLAPTAPVRQIACIRPLSPTSPSRVNSSPLHQNSPVAEVPLVDLTNEDTVPYESRFDPYEPIELIDLEPDNIEAEPLEPLVPDLEYRENIHRIFVNLDAYARHAFNNIADV